MFPGSLKLFQRSTEANYRTGGGDKRIAARAFKSGNEHLGAAQTTFCRTEIARHYIINVRQLWMFLRHVCILES